MVAAVAVMRRHPTVALRHQAVKAIMAGLVEAALTSVAVAVAAVAELAATGRQQIEDLAASVGLA